MQRLRIEVGGEDYWIAVYCERWNTLEAVGSPVKYQRKDGEKKVHTEIRWRFDSTPGATCHHRCYKAPTTNPYSKAIRGKETPGEGGG
jgi:hypothetical protein